MPYYLYLQKILMDKSKCGLEWCSEPIPPGRHGNAGGCCPEHSALIKALKEKARYQENAQLAKQVKDEEKKFKQLAEIFGYNKAIKIGDLSPSLLNWSISTGSFQKEGKTGIAVGCIGYITNDDFTIKIYKIC